MAGQSAFDGASAGFFGGGYSSIGGG